MKSDWDNNDLQLAFSTAFFSFLPRLPLFPFLIIWRLFMHPRGSFTSNQSLLKPESTVTFALIISLQGLSIPYKLCKWQPNKLTNLNQTNLPAPSCCLLFFLFASWVEEEDTQPVYCTWLRDVARRCVLPIFKLVVLVRQLCGVPDLNFFSSLKTRLRWVETGRCVCVSVCIVLAEHYVCQFEKCSCCRFSSYTEVWDFSVWTSANKVIWEFTGKTVFNTWFVSAVQRWF